jgi:hypothetical protein
MNSDVSQNKVSYVGSSLVCRISMAYISRQAIIFQQHHATQLIPPNTSIDEGRLLNQQNGNHQVSILNYTRIHQILQRFISNHSILLHLIPQFPNLQLPPYPRPPLNAQSTRNESSTRRAQGLKKGTREKLLHRLRQYFKPTHARSNENKEARTRAKWEDRERSEERRL